MANQLQPTKLPMQSGSAMSSLATCRAAPGTTSSLPYKLVPQQLHYHLPLTPIQPLIPPHIRPPIPPPKRRRQIRRPTNPNPNQHQIRNRLLPGRNHAFTQRVIRRATFFTRAALPISDVMRRATVQPQGFVIAGTVGEAAAAVRRERAQLSVRWVGATDEGRQQEDEDGISDHDDACPV